MIESCLPDEVFLRIKQIYGRYSRIISMISISNHKSMPYRDGHNNGNSLA